jgi:O-antigen ligase
MAIGVLLGVIASSALLCADVFSGQWPRRLILNSLSVAPTKHNIGVVEGSIPAVAFLYLLNRSVSVSQLLIWPALLMIAGLDLRPRTKVCLLAGLLPGVAGILGSVHGTSKLALAGATTIYALFWLSPWFAKRLTTAAWILAMLCVVPLAAAAYNAELYHAHWLPLSAQHRIVIWGYTSDQVAKAPLLGSGIATARALADVDSPDLPKAPGTIFQLSTHVHSHNAYLQIWFETGAIGAVLFLVIGLLVLRSFGRVADRAQPYLYAAFSACALLAGSSFSIWAPWLLATYAIVAILMSLGVALVPKADQQSG